MIRDVKGSNHMILENRYRDPTLKIHRNKMNRSILQLNERVSHATEIANFNLRIINLYQLKRINVLYFNLHNINLSNNI